MTREASTNVSFGLLPLLVFVGLFPIRTGRGQPNGRSAPELIRLLTYQTDGSDSRFERNFMDGQRENRADATSLAALGASAIPDIEAALDLIERNGQQTPFASNSRWLLFAYARIKGPDAFRRLRAMLDNPRLSFLRRDLENSLAIAFGLTSYVSNVTLPEAAYCCRFGEPRDAMDQLILALGRTDRRSLESQLGPTARSSLSRLLAAQSWEHLRADSWSASLRPGLALGYRIRFTGPWSQPEETLNQELQDSRRHIVLEQSLMNPELEIQFVDSSGTECGQRKIMFARTPENRTGSLEDLLGSYVVNDPDLGGILRIIGACATR